MPLLPLLAAIASVAIGTFLALIPGFGPSAVGHVRTFALIAALTVVAGDLLPESIEGIGLVAIAVVLAGVFLPGWVEHVLERRLSIGLELGYAALVIHHVADGVALAVYADLSVVIALVAHTIPVIAVVVLRFSTERGRTHAIVRAALLGMSIAVGVVLGRLVSPETIEAFTPWIAALVSGLLLHVITHDLHTDPPISAPSRALDFGMAMIGVLFPIFASGFDREVGERFFSLALDFAPPLVLAVVASFFLRPKPREMSAAMLAAWAIARRFLAFEAVVVCFVFLGGALTVLYVACALVLAGLCALFARDGAPGTLEPIAQDEGLVPWAIAGTLFAAYLGFERASFSPLDIAGCVAALLVMTAAPIAARVAFVALLAHRGFPLPLAFAALLFDRTAVRGYRSWMAMVIVAAGGAMAAGQLDPPARSLRAPDAVATISVVLLLVYLAYQMYRRGPRAYLASLSSEPAHSHDH